MKWILMVGIVVFPVVLCVSVGVATEANPDSLWEKAVELSEANQGMIPGLMVMRMEEVNKRGEPKNDNEYYEVWTRHTPGKNGDVVEETVKVVENGKDITDQAKTEREEAERKEEMPKAADREDEESGPLSWSSYSPFRPKDQRDYSFQATGEEEVVSGRPCAVYQFEGTTEKGGSRSGKAWLEEKTGVPVRIKYTQDDVPEHVKTCWTTTDFEYAPDGSPHTTELAVVMTAGTLFFKQHHRLTITMSEYWRMPEGEDE